VIEDKRKRKIKIRSLKKVSSGSRTEKPEKQSEAGAAKLMKPRIELNLSGRIGF
jgi:hypothetical protein